MNITHPFIKYAIALVEQEHNITWDSPKWVDKVSFEISRGISHFRVKPKGDFKGKERISFIYSDDPKGDTHNGVYLSPSILTPDKTAGNIYKSLLEIKDKVKTDAKKTTDAKMSIAPTSGEYLSFGEKDTGRGKPKITYLEAALCLITATTPFKPTMAYKRLIKKKIERTNTAIIPDLSIGELKDFIALFKAMLFSKTDKLFEGKIYKDIDKKGNIKSEKPQRPKLHDGNYPNAPISSALGCIGLLGAIGEWAKEANEVKWASKVLDSLKEANMYIISYGNVQTFSYNHYIIDLAKEDRLKSIVDSFYYSQLLDKKRWQHKEEYEKFDLFIGRFLLFFNNSSFRDFLSFRAEYPSKISLLLNTYFIKMANISPEVVISARALGKWLNYVAYSVAKQEAGAPNSSHDYWEKVRKFKAKVLVELESSTFSARTGDALIAQAITRAGRLSGMDAPEEAGLFMEKTCSGELELDNAKNLLIAFSRLINRYEKKESPLKDVTEEEQEEATDEDHSDAQE